jgi:hypothetical protein
LRDRDWPASMDERACPSCSIGACAGSCAIEVRIGAAQSPPADPGVITARSYTLQPDGTAFLQPVSLTVRYEESQVPTGVREDELVLRKVVDGVWQPVSANTVATDPNAVRGQIMGFSSYAPGRPAGSSGARIIVAPATITRRH